VLCGDMNVALTDLDVHPKERKPGIIGQRPDERALMAQIIDRGLVDVHRKLEPDNPDLFTWWAPWRNMKERNIGWRLDLILASTSIADRAASCVVARGRIERPRAGCGCVRITAGKPVDGLYGVARAPRGIQGRPCAQVRQMLVARFPLS